MQTIKMTNNKGAHQQKSGSALAATMTTHETPQKRRLASALHTVCNSSRSVRRKHSSVVHATVANCTPERQADKRSQTTHGRTRRRERLSNIVQLYVHL